jgi:hypothetical protein
LNQVVRAAKRMKDEITFKMKDEITFNRRSLDRSKSYVDGRASVI